MENPVVKTSDGHLKGATGTNIDGGRFYSFLGIPYAKPPIGALRFKVSQVLVFNNYPNLFKKIFIFEH